MAAQHSIDNNRNLIITTWSGPATDSDLIQALSEYQQHTKNRPEYDSYDEIVDLGGVTKFKLSTEGIKKLVQVAARSDVPGKRTRLAIIVNQPVAYGMARMYEVYRSLQTNVVKEIRVFMKYDDAQEWIESKTH